MLHNLEIIWHGPYRVEFLQAIAGTVVTAGIVMLVLEFVFAWHWSRECRRRERKEAEL